MPPNFKAPTEMYYVYVLKLINNRLYFGYSANLKRRICEHIQNKVISTKNRTPSLVYYEAYRFKEEAIQREKEIKKGKGREDIKRKLFVTLNKI